MSAKELPYLSDSDLEESRRYYASRKSRLGGRLWLNAFERASIPVVDRMFLAVNAEQHRRGITHDRR